MIFMKYRSSIKRVWERSATGAYREDSVLMRVLLTGIIATRLLSLSNLKDARAAGTRWRRNFMDCYVLGWLILLSSLLFTGAARRWQGLIAAYNVAEVVHYRVYFLLIKGWHEPWTPGRLRRSLVLALLSTVQIVIGYAIMFRTLAQIGVAGAGKSGGTLLTPIQALYFSAITFTTVGYGDLSPLDGGSQLLVITELAASLLSLAILIPLVLTGFATRLHRSDTDN
jgi:hypothetical protein